MRATVWPARVPVPPGRGAVVWVERVMAGPSCARICKRRFLRSVDSSINGGSSALDSATRNPRAPRADAQRNRDALIAAATTAFATADDTVALETIARSAGVGIGTLYRHFATREALVEAVYAAELDDVTASAASLLAELPPDQALRAWMQRY